MATDIRDVDLLIIGAGPAGLMAACWAAQYNISARIIDQKDGRTRVGHADGLQNRTLEILDSFGLADDILKQGVLISEECYWVSVSNEASVYASLTSTRPSIKNRAIFGV